MQDGAQLELKFIGDIRDRFFVPSYQRGYRWGQHEVRCLLEDIEKNGDNPYCLQPVVVKRRTDGEWELVDGQQRLTTLYLIYLYMQRERLKRSGPRFRLRYETRPDSEAYLEELDPARREANIDFYHLYEAYSCIRAWFEGHGHRQELAADDIYRYLFNRVQVIWYEAPPELDSATLFTRLNVGRIPLTDAELIKALLLSRSRGGAGKPDRTQELAAQWDAIEHDLQRPEVWAFVTSAQPEEHPTRITLLLDTLAGGPQGRERPRFYTFDALRTRIEAEGPEAIWNEVVRLHAQVLGWFDNRSLYHKIGFLVADGLRFDEIVQLATACARSCFEAKLDEQIRSRLNLSRGDVQDLRYDVDRDRERCTRLLLLMNVETTRRLEHSSERFPFLTHRQQAWSLEHIHAQHAEGLNRVEQWKAWLAAHRKALAGLPVADGRRATRCSLRSMPLKAIWGARPSTSWPRASPSSSAAKGTASRVPRAPSTR